MGGNSKRPGKDARHEDIKGAEQPCLQRAGAGGGTKEALWADHHLEPVSAEAAEFLRRTPFSEGCPD